MITSHQCDCSSEKTNVTSWCFRQVIFSTDKAKQ